MKRKSICVLAAFVTILTQSQLALADKFVKLRYVQTGELVRTTHGEIIDDGSVAKLYAPAEKGSLSWQN